MLCDDEGSEADQAELLYEQSQQEKEVEVQCGGLYIVDSIYTELSLASNRISFTAGDEQLNEVAEAIQSVEAKLYDPDMLEEQSYPLQCKQRLQGGGVAYGR